MQTCAAKWPTQFYWQIRGSFQWLPECVKIVKDFSSQNMKRMARFLGTNDKQEDDGDNQPHRGNAPRHRKKIRVPRRCDGGDAHEGKRKESCDGQSNQRASPPDPAFPGLLKFDTEKLAIIVGSFDTESADVAPPGDFRTQGHSQIARYG
jgi:hypothetical protein